MNGGSSWWSSGNELRFRSFSSAHSASYSATAQFRYHSGTVAGALASIAISDRRPAEADKDYTRHSPPFESGKEELIGERAGALKLQSKPPLIVLVVGPQAVSIQHRVSPCCTGASTSMLMHFPRAWHSRKLAVNTTAYMTDPA